MNITESAHQVDVENPIVKIKHLDVFYGNSQALFDIKLDIATHQVTALIGPSGCGKSTLLRCINRMNDLVPNMRVDGKLKVNGKSVLKKNTDVITLRRTVGMVFQKPNPFPKSIYENVVFGLRVAGVKDRNTLDEAVETTLKGAALWDEVKDRLRESAYSLSGGQMQRLCIARAIAVNPDVLLMDEPTSALDPIAGGKVEELIVELKKKYTVVIVTHNMQQASRISDYTAFLYMGKLNEFNRTSTLFTTPAHSRTQDYITGRFG